MIRTSILIVLIFTSCTSREKETGSIDTLSETKETAIDQKANDEITSFYFLADSTFVSDFKLKDKIPIPDLNQPLFGDSESDYSYFRDKASYYQIDEFKVSDTKTGKIIYADFPSAIFDGTLKLFFLATYDADNTEIDNIQLAKDEMHSDVSYLETAELNDLVIKRKTKFMGVSDDGSLIEQETEETYQVDDQGMIHQN